MRSSALLALLLTTACDDPAAPRTAPAIADPSPHDDDACGDEPPTIDGLSVLAVADDLGPRFVYLMIASDPDGALHFATLRVWHDLAVDGAVDTATDPTWTLGMDLLNAESMAADLPEVCGVTGGFPMSIGMSLEETGIPFGVPVEVAIALVDADGWESAPVLAEACLDDPRGEATCP